MESTNVSASTNIAPVKTPKFPGWIVVLIIVLVLIVAGLVAAIVVTLTQSSTATAMPSAVVPPTVPTQPQTIAPAADPTSNWKTYNNEELGIIFKHPADWAVKSRPLAESVEEREGSNLQIGEIMSIKTGAAKDDQYELMKYWLDGKEPFVLAPVTINGTIHTFKKITFGQAVAPSANCTSDWRVDNYYFEVNESLVLIKNEESAVCDGNDDQTITKTKVQDLETARLIAESISFIE